jgi:hypothetical protein
LLDIYGSIKKMSGMDKSGHNRSTFKSFSSLRRVFPAPGAGAAPPPVFIASPTLEAKFPNSLVALSWILDTVFTELRKEAPSWPGEDTPPAGPCPCVAREEKVEEAEELEE